MRTRDAALSPFRADETDEAWAADPLGNASSADALHADALHADALHADALHADALHADALKADAAHADALKADAAHADALAELRGAITGHYKLQVIASDCL